MMDARGEQLKGCPFCGSDKVSICMDCGRHHFKCHCCGMMFEFSADTKTELIRKWNRRAQPLERAEAAEAEARRTTGGEVETPRRGGEGMKILDYALWLFGALFLVAVARTLGHYKMGTFEEIMLVMILIQVMTRGVEGK